MRFVRVAAKELQIAGISVSCGEASNVAGMGAEETVWGESNPKRNENRKGRMA